MLSVIAALLFASVVFIVLINKTQVKLSSQLECIYKDTQVTFLCH